MFVKAVRVLLHSIRARAVEAMKCLYTAQVVRVLEKVMRTGRAQDLFVMLLSHLTHLVCSIASILFLELITSFSLRFCLV